MTSATGLARVTVSAPQRRLDVALPEHAPLGELLPELLRHAGEGLPDAGQAHGGWVLRRADGSPLSVGAGLAHQGVRDGDVLHLVPARVGWPELEYDDVVDAIAAGARRYGRAWDGAATRLTGLVAAGVAVLLGLGQLLRSGDRLSSAIALSLAGLLLLGGIVAARAFADGVVGATVAGYALPCAFAGGYLLLRGAPGILVGGTTLLLAGMIGAVGVGHGSRVFVAGVTAGCFAAFGALVAYRQPAPGAAAVVLAVLMTGVAAFPLLAIRLGRLVTGMLLGHAVATLGAAAVLVRGGGVAGRLLVAVAAAGFLVRARLFPTVRQRVPLLAAGGGAAALLLVSAGGVPRLAIVGALAGLALVAVLAGTAYRRRAPGPYLGRAADILDALCVVAAIPVACAVLGLYGRMRGLMG
ncbi:MAG: type VII secretion integral membrane protein EccD [Actinobacteria bacterium 13_1_20CM_3_71_11]|nr:MAG: type VII secretion integral membrane protein EccD [Actinobacteria bacterium 13_1_20CM_3_71_11]